MHPKVKLYGLWITFCYNVRKVYVMCFMMDFVVFLFSLVSKNMISKILMVK